MSPQLSTPDLFPHEGLLAAEAEQAVAETIRHWQRAGLTAAEAWAALGHRGVATSWVLPRAFMLRWWIGQAEAARAASPLVTTSVTAALNARGNRMSRTRSIHPSQWTDEDFVECSAMARLLLLGLRNEADDHGVFEWRPASLKMRLLPADAVDVLELLAELVDHGQLARFEAEGRTYGVCLVWGQKPRHPSYRHPAPPADLIQRSEFDDGGLTAERGNPPADDGTTHAAEQSRAEQSSSGQGSAPAREAHPPEDLPDEWREKARHQRTEAEKPDADLDEQWRRFRNHFAETPDRRLTLGRWLNWALDAKPAANGQAPTTMADPAAPPRTETAEAQAQRLWWGRSHDWWGRFNPSQQTRARLWVDRGEWRVRTPPPGTPGCLLDDELAQAAVAERARRLAEAPEILMPIAGGAAGAEAAAARSPPHKPPDQRRARAG